MLKTRRHFAAALLLVFTAPTAFAAEKQPADRFVSNARQLTLEGARAGEGYFSPDGSKLIFQSERDPKNPFFQIYILDLTTGDTHRVSTGVGDTTCAFFRPGTDDVLFASTHLDPDARKKQEQRLAQRAAGQEPRYAWDYDPHMDIFTSKQDGAQLRRLTDAPGYDAEGAYSPDGSKIVFCSLRDTPPPDKLNAEEKHYAELDPSYFGEIYIMDADGGNQTRLTNWPGYDGGPFFTPDGQRIVWRHFVPGTMRADIYTVKLDGSDRRQLTDFGSMSWAPYFHPSGEYCVFNSNKLGMDNWELFLVDARGEKEPVRVTHSPGADLLGVFSPDGKKLSWTSTRHGASGRKGQIYLADWDHEAARAAVRAAPPRAAVAPAADESETALESFAKTQREAAAETAEDSPSLKEYAEKQRATQADAAAQTELAKFAEKQREISRNFAPQITAEDLGAHAAYLAAPQLAGRMTGTPGARAAAEYIAAEFQRAGLQPLGDNGTYFQTFPYLAGVHADPAGTRLAVRAGEQSRAFTLDKDFRPLGFSDNTEFSGEVVFAGYGIIGEGYDSYGDLDVKDKCVIVLRYFPENFSAARKTVLAPHASLRAKAMHARRLGAKALLVATGPNSPHAGELIKLGVDGATTGSGVPAASISLDVLNDLFAKSAGSRNIREVQEALDQENPHAQTSFALAGVKVDLAVTLRHEKRECRNVVGLIPAEQASADACYVVIGAHYDHLGHGEAGDAFGYDESKVQIYHGADDNASGVSAVLEVAAETSAQPAGNGKPRGCGIICAAWSGEEVGVIGSEYFVEHPPVSTNSLSAYLNLDMVGRMQDNRLVVQGAGSSPAWRSLIERRNVPVGFNLTIQDDPYLPTDTSGFYRSRIPVLQFFTGSHEDYHRPSDTAEKLNYPDLVRVARLAQLVINDLASAQQRPAYAKVERSATARAGGGMGMRAYTGTEPDYAYVPEAGATPGMKLKGVIPGGPADQAGVKPGDVIVEIAGLEVTNVYEYSHALSVLKPGETVKMVVVRGGERKELSITPTARD